MSLDVTVEESPSAEASASLGYGTTGPQFNASFNQYNFMGTGRTVGLGFDASYWGQNYNFNYYNPFYTNTGVGRGLNVYFQTSNPKRLDVSAYSSDRFGGDVNYTVLLSEKSSLQLGYGYQGMWIKSVGNVQQIQNFENLYGRDFAQIRLNGGWNRNSYDKMPYPDSGVNQQAEFLSPCLPEQNRLTIIRSHTLRACIILLTKGFIFTVLGNVGYGNTFDQRGLPFYENYYAGGTAQPGQVRGYEPYSLGPKG